MATTSLSLSLPPPPPPPFLLSISTKQYLSLPFSSSLPLPTLLSPKPTSQFQNSHRSKPQIWRTLVSPQEALPSDTAPPLETSQQIVSASGDDPSGTVVQFLLFIAFLALSILTVGVIYIGVTDFLRKRESEKFKNEEETKKKKSGKKGKVRARAGPRGFGQKIEEED